MIKICRNKSFCDIYGTIPLYKGKFQMQERVTSYHYYSRIKSKKETVLRNVLCCVVFVVFLSFVCSFLIDLFSSSNKNKCFSETKVFYISLANTKSKSSVDSLKNKIQSVGGAGYVLTDKNKFEIIGFVYEKKEVANVIMAQVGERFDSKIIEKKLPEISKKAKQKIKSNLEFLEALKFVYCENFDLLDNVSLFFNGKIAIAKMYQLLQKSKLEAEIIEKNMKDDYGLENLNDMKKVFCITLSSVKEILQNMMNEIYRSSNVSVSLKSGIILFCETHALLRENLNKIK